MLFHDLTPAPELINSDSAGNSLSSPKMALDVSKRTLPRTPAEGRDVLVALGALGALRAHARVACQFRDSVSSQMEGQDCQEKPEIAF